MGFEHFPGKARYLSNDSFSNVAIWLPRQLYSRKHSIRCEKFETVA